MNLPQPAEALAAKGRSAEGSVRSVLSAGGWGIETQDMNLCQLVCIPSRLAWDQAVEFPRLREAGTGRQRVCTGQSTMRSVLVRFLLALGISVEAGASEVNLHESERDEEGVKLREMRICARLKPNEVLVVRSVRKENDRTVVEIEEIYGPLAAPFGLVVELRQMGPDYWQLREPAAEQYLQGVSIAQWEKLRGEFRLGFTPDKLRAQRRHAFVWQSRVEQWADVRRRYPKLPAPNAAASEWPIRRIIYSALAGTPG